MHFYLLTSLSSKRAYPIRPFLYGYAGLDALALFEALLFRKSFISLIYKLSAIIFTNEDLILFWPSRCLFKKVSIFILKIGVCQKSLPPSISFSSQTKYVASMIIWYLKSPLQKNIRIVC